MSETKELELKPRPEGNFSATIQTVNKKVIVSSRHVYLMLKLSNGQGFLNIHNRRQIEKLIRQNLIRGETIPALKSEQDLTDWIERLAKLRTAFSFIRKWKVLPSGELFEDIRFA